MFCNKEIKAYRKIWPPDLSGNLAGSYKKPENRDPSRTLEKPGKWDRGPLWYPSRTLRISGKWDPGPLWEPSRTPEKPGTRDPRHVSWWYQKDLIIRTIYYGTIFSAFFFIVLKKILRPLFVDWVQPRRQFPFNH